MGRPINKKFFGNLNRPYDNMQTGGNTGVGGESVVSSITISNSGTIYSQGATVAIGAPNIAGGIPATISYSVNSAGNISVALVEGGTGYTSAPSITVTKPTTRTPTATAVNGNFTLTSVSNVTGIFVGMRLDGSPGVQTSTFVTSVGTNTVTLSKTMTASTSSNTYQFSDAGASFTATTALSSNTQNAIAFSSFLLAKDGGLSAVTGGDIQKQEASRRYTVKNSQGTGQVKLVTTSTLTAGTMNVIATDVNGSTYFVKKLTARRVTLVRNVVSGSFEYATNQAAGWRLGSATTGTVSIASV
jgi:hypothetical protein